MFVYKLTMGVSLGPVGHGPCRCVVGSTVFIDPLYIFQCRNSICTVVPASGRAEYINVCCVYLDVVNRLWIGALCPYLNK